MAKQAVHTLFLNFSCGVLESLPLLVSLVFPNVEPSTRPKKTKNSRLSINNHIKITFLFNMGEGWSIFKCMLGGGEKGESIIKSPNLKMFIFYIFNFRCVAASKNVYLM